MDIKRLDTILFLDLQNKARENERKRMNFDLRTSEADTSQRMLNALEPGTLVPIHRHEDTTETILCLQGKLDEVFYEKNDNEDFVEVSRITICPSEGVYGLQVPKGVWHTIDVKEPSIIFEAKDGAYKPVPQN